MISDTAVMVAWVEFAKARAEGIHDPRSMRRALEAAEKYMVPTVPDERIEAFAIRAALGNNGGTWADHYTEGQKEHWRQWVRDLMDAANKMEHSKP